MDTLNQPSSNQNQPATEQQQSVPLNPSLHLKTFLLIAGAIVLMAISAMGGYFLGVNKQQPSQPPTQPSQSLPTPTPTPTSTPLIIPTTDPLITANWKTYANIAFKYSFKYPPDWRLPQKDVYGKVPQGNRVLVSSPDPVGTGQYPDKLNPDSLTVGVYILSKTPEIAEYWKKGLKNAKDTTVDGLKAQTGISFSGTASDMSPEDPSSHNWTTIIDYDSKIYNISASPLNSKKIDIYYKILSTFKFTQ